MKDGWHRRLQTKVGQANTGTCGQDNNWLQYDAAAIRTETQDLLDAGNPTITFGFKMETESGGHWAMFSPNLIKLSATLKYKPYGAEALHINDRDNKCDQASPGRWVNTRTPKLYAKAYDEDENVMLLYDLDGPTSPAEHLTSFGSSGAERVWTAPSLTEGNYKWRVQGRDNHYGSDWSGWCYFRLDATPPSAPVVTRLSGDFVPGEEVTLEFSSSDARSGLKGYAYGLGVDSPEDFASASGSTTISFTPKAGRNFVYVWAQDNANNYSVRTMYNFDTGRIAEAVAVGVWRLDGDLRDDSGQGGNLDAIGDIAYGADRAGKAGAAVAFDGSGCLEAPAKLRSDVEHTIAGWVNLADKGTDRVLAAQIGTTGPASAVVYSAAADRWQVRVSGADSAGAPVTTVSAPTATGVGVWQHVAATVDPVGPGLVRLYVNGQMVAEDVLGMPIWNAMGAFRIGCGSTGGAIDGYMRGAVDHVAVWQGLLSEAQIVTAAQELPAGLAAGGRCTKTVTTRAAASSLAASGLTFVDDPWGRQTAAARFDGARCARTVARVLRTDASFTAAAWVKLASVGDSEQTVLAANGDSVPAWSIGGGSPQGSSTGLCK